MKALLAVLVAGVAIGHPGSVTAGVTFYSDPAAFAAAAGTLTTIDFEGVVADTSFQVQQSHTFSGVTFQPIEIALDNSLICGRLVCVGNPFDSAVYVSNRGSALNINLPAGIVAAGGFFGDLDGPGFNATFTVFNGATELDTHIEFLNDFGAGLTHDFLGWIADGGDAITRINVDGSGNLWTALDNFSISASTASVPEPATLGLLGIALAGLGFSRRKRAVN